MAKPIPATLVESASLYESERKIYPRDIDGRLQTLRKIAVWWLLGMFYLGPWLRWDGRQAILFDLPARKFHVFGLAFWPQDFVFLALLLAIAGLALFFFTALAGRLWCGYACPQTVWTEVFLWMERWTEGDRGRRMKLDAAPWSRNKLLRKGSKHLLWLVFALWTGFTFVGFFTPIAELAASAPLRWSGWEMFWVYFYALATWGNAGFLREQVCKYMCPYARFQSAMFDRNTLIIAYDPRRGEPRGPRRRGLVSVLERARGLLVPADAYDFVARAVRRTERVAVQGSAGGTIALLDAPVDAAAWSDFAPDALGDCIDCTMCVQVCPTGIDIRNGLQYECIACGACIDACDSVMDKMQYPRGLIRYATQNALDGKPVRIVRPRIVIYGLLLVVFCVAWAAGVLLRSPLIVDVLRDRNAMYRSGVDGIENDYTLRLVNKDGVARRYRISIEGGEVLVLKTPPTLDAGPEAVLTVPLIVQARGAVHGRQTVAFVVESEDGSVRRRVDSSFFGPM